MSEAHTKHTKTRAANFRAKLVLRDFLPVVNMRLWCKFRFEFRFEFPFGETEFETEFDISNHTQACRATLLCTNSPFQAGRKPLPGSACTQIPFCAMQAYFLCIFSLLVWSTYDSNFPDMFLWAPLRLF